MPEFLYRRPGARRILLLKLGDDKYRLRLFLPMGYTSATPVAPTHIIFFSLTRPIIAVIPNLFAFGGCGVLPYPLVRDSVLFDNHLAPARRAAGVFWREHPLQPRTHFL